MSIGIFSGKTSAWAVLALCILLFSACSTTNADVDKWANSVGGEKQIAKIMSNLENEQSVRIYAAQKLVSLQQVELMVATLKGMPKNSRANLVNLSGGEIGKMLRHPDMKVQAAAKDTLYMYMSMEQNAIKKNTRQAIMDWYGSEFEKKFSKGKFSGFTVLSSMGSAAGPVLATIFEKNEKMRVKVAKIIEKIDDKALTAKISKIMIGWYEKDKKLSPEILELACYVRDPHLTGIMNAYLLDQKKALKDRLNVANTLTFHPSSKSIAVATRIFINRREPVELRGIAIELVEKAGDKSLLEYLLPFIADEDVKWAAFAAVLKLGGVEAIEPAFKKLNPKVKYWRDDYDVARRHLKKLDKTAAEKLVPFLSSKHVPIVALALIGLQYTADAELAEKSIKPLFEDKRKIKNYFEKKKFTIGQLAKQAHRGAVGK